MKTSSVVWLIVVIVVVIAGIFWIMGMSAQTGTSSNALYPSATSTDQSGQTPGTGTTNGTGTATGAGAGTAVLTLNTATSPTLGTYLTATDGRTLYRYTKDTANKSNCTGQCAVLWPPYTVVSTSSLAGSIDATGQIGTIKRTDGSLQVTYKGKPLYFYSKDTAAGQTTGQNVGGVWFVVAP